MGRPCEAIASSISVLGAAAVAAARAVTRPTGIAVPARLLGDLDDDQVAMTRGAAAHRAARRTRWLMRRLSGVTNPMPRLEREAARNLRRAALEHLDDRALRAAAFVAPGDARRHAVAVKQHAHLAVGQEQVVAAVVRHQEPEAVAVAARPCRRRAAGRSTRQYSSARFSSSSPSRTIAPSRFVERLTRARLPRCRAAPRVRRRPSGLPRLALVSRAGARGSGSGLRSAPTPRGSAGPPAASAGLRVMGSLQIDMKRVPA